MASPSLGFSPKGLSQSICSANAQFHIRLLEGCPAGTVETRLAGRVKSRIRSSLGKKGYWKSTQCFKQNLSYVIFN